MGFESVSLKATIIFSAIILFAILFYSIGMLSETSEMAQEISQDAESAITNAADVDAYVIRAYKNSMEITVFRAEDVGSLQNMVKSHEASSIIVYFEGSPDVKEGDMITGRVVFRSDGRMNRFFISEINVTSRI